MLKIVMFLSSLFHGYLFKSTYYVFLNLPIMSDWHMGPHGKWALYINHYSKHIPYYASNAPFLKVKDC